MKIRKPQLGMSMIEVMVVLLITTVITGAVFEQIVTVQRRAASEQVKLDLFQEARDFMDQMSRDLHQAGYPNPKNLASAQVSSPNDFNSAIGLVKITPSELRFEGDVDGDGQVESMRYELITTGDNCPCLRRSQIAKQTGDPLSGQGTPAWYTEIQHVQNGSSTDPIFTALTGGGTPITSDVAYSASDYTSGNPTGSQNLTLASIDTVKIVIRTQARNPDPQTGTRPSSTLVSTIRLNNCSSSAAAMPMSCQ